MPLCPKYAPLPAPGPGAPGKCPGQTPLQNGENGLGVYPAEGMKAILRPANPSRPAIFPTGQDPFPQGGGVAGHVAGKNQKGLARASLQGRSDPLHGTAFKAAVGHRAKPAPQGKMGVVGGKKLFPKRSKLPFHPVQKGLSIPKKKGLLHPSQPAALTAGQYQSPAGRMIHGKVPLKAKNRFRWWLRPSSFV